MPEDHVTTEPMASDEQFKELSTLLKAAWKEKKIAKTTASGEVSFSFKITKDDSLSHLYALAKAMEP